MEQAFTKNPAKFIANVFSSEDSAALAKQLRALADDIESGAALPTDVYASVNMLATTPEGAEFQTVAQDRSSYVFLIRFMRPDPQVADAGGG